MRQSDVHYIGGTDILPAPLELEEEAEAISKLGTEKRKKLNQGLLSIT